MPGAGPEGMSSIIVQGGEQYGLEDPRAEMDLLRHEIDISIDQKLKGVEKRLQVSTALAALKPQLLADLHARFQGFDSRLQVCTTLFVCPCMHACDALPYHAMSAIARYAMLCYAMLCYAMLCYAMLCHAMPCHAMPCYAMLCHAMPLSLCSFDQACLGTASDSYD